MPTALIVEDEPEANRLLAMLVQLRGYATESAFTGNEALEKVRRRVPDVVFLDLMLPDINGYEVCKYLKARRATSLVPVVVVTARVAEENRVESFGVGADDYIPKPYTPDQIFQALVNASSWRGRIGCRTLEGVIPIGAGCREETLRQIGLFRNILVARTSLDPEAIQGINAALREIWQDALDWCRRTRHPLDSAIGYHVQPDRLAVTLRDNAGWLAENHFPPEERWPAAFAAAGFDEVVAEEPGHRWTFHKRYPPCDPPYPS